MSVNERELRDAVELALLREKHKRLKEAAKAYLKAHEAHLEDQIAGRSEVRSGFLLASAITTLKAELRDD